MAYKAGPGRLKAGLLALALAAGGAAATAGPVTVAALGDSLTQGFGLPPEDGLVPQLQGWLAARGHDAVIVNAGVSGDTTAGGLARIGWTLTPEVEALIVALGANDMLRGIAPEVARANLDGILAEARSRDLPVLLIGITAPGNFGPDYTAAFEAIYAGLAGEYGTLLVPDMFAPLRGTPPERAAEVMQPDGIHPNAAGVALIVEAIGPEVAALLERAAP